MSDVKENIDLKYRKVANVLNKAGEFPFPVSDTLLNILKINIKEEHLDFIMAFRRNISQTMEQLKKSSKLSEDEILQKVDELAKKGVIFNQPNRQGLMIYRLLPIGRQFDYGFMKKVELNEENKELAVLFHKLYEEVGIIFQNNYDAFVTTMGKLPPMDRTVPVMEKESGEGIQITLNAELEVPVEKILPTQRIEEIIKKHNDIAVGLCFCRQHKYVLGEPCKQYGLKESCFTLGKSARHTSNHGFSRLISQEEALEILKDIEAAGLVHKAYHLHSDINKEEVAICNCCKCCCPNARAEAFIPVNNVANWLAEINQDLCIGCGTCVEKCHMDAIQLNDDDKAEIGEEYCIGCGVCAYFCPENAISLTERKRIVSIIPPRQN